MRILITNDKCFFFLFSYCSKEWMHPVSVFTERVKTVGASNNTYGFLFLLFFKNISALICCPIGDHIEKWKNGDKWRNGVCHFSPLKNARFVAGAAVFFKFFIFHQSLWQKCCWSHLIWLSSFVYLIVNLNSYNCWNFLHKVVAANCIKYNITLSHYN